MTDPLKGLSIEKMAAVMVFLLEGPDRTVEDLADAFETDERYAQRYLDGLVKQNLMQIVGNKDVRKGKSMRLCATNIYRPLMTITRASP